MVRTYKRKRDNSPVSRDVIMEAISDVQNEGFSLRTAALRHGMTHTSLYYHLQKFKRDVQPDAEHGRYATRQVFTTENEAQLENYLIQCSKLHYGLRYKQVRELAYNFALRLGCTYPESWNVNKCAGIDWMDSFMKRHPNLTLRKPENTSQARCNAFSKKSVMEFFDNYEKALTYGNFTPEKIYNLDETGVSTVTQTPKVVAQRGARQVGQAVSAERGTMITMCMIVNAIGNSIPPVFIFPRARMHDTLMFGAPVGSLGLANNPNSSWMTSELFIKVLEHVQKHTQCSKNNKIILLMDNHESHCSIEAINYAVENGMILVTFPPHCTHRMQPLDVGLMGPFKGHLKIVQNDWMITNPGKRLTIHNLAALSNTAYLSSFTTKNILAAFAKPGIWPFSKLAFSDGDFEPSTVTDTVRTDNENTSTDANVAGSVSEQEDESNDTDIVVTPETVRPYPKSVPTSSGRKPRKTAKSRILTASPVRAEIEANTLARRSKKSGQPKHRETKGRKTAKKRTAAVSDVIDNDSVAILEPPSRNDKNPDTEELGDSIAIGSYVICSVPSKTRHFYCVGCVEEENVDSYQIKCLVKSKDCYKFDFPKKEMSKDVKKSDVIIILPQPQNSGGTARTKDVKMFDFDFSGFKDLLL